jgi:hypothetical protein
MPVVPATQEGEVEGLLSEAGPTQRKGMRHYLKNN